MKTNCPIQKSLIGRTWTELALGAFLATFGLGPVLVLALLPRPLLAGEVSTIPPAPILKVGENGERDLHGFAKSGSSYHLTNPYIPPVSSSRDSRVGLIRKATSAGKARFVLLSPERLGAPPVSSHVLGVDGPAILATGNVLAEVEIAKSEFHNAVATATHNPFVSHFAICDPKFPEANPKDCAGDEDCYSLKVIAGVIFRDNQQDSIAQPPYLQI